MSGIISPTCRAMKRLCSKPSSRKETAAPAGPPIVRSTTLQVRRTPRRGKASKCVPWHFSNHHAFDIPQSSGRLPIQTLLEGGVDEINLLDDLAPSFKVVLANIRGSKLSNASIKKRVFKLSLRGRDFTAQGR